jgi:hypothetical protein
MDAFCEERARNTRCGRTLRPVTLKPFPATRKISNLLAKRICHKLSIPDPPG